MKWRAERLIFFSATFFWLLFSFSGFFFPSSFLVSVCVSAFCVVMCFCVSAFCLCVCVCVCVCWCWVGFFLKNFFWCWVGITIFPMGLSHPSGTLEKKKKKVKEKKGKKRKEKKENAPGGQMKRKTHWVSRRKRTIGVCVFFFSFGLSCTSLSCLLSCLSPSLQQQHQGTRITSATVSVP